MWSLAATDLCELVLVSGEGAEAAHDERSRRADVMADVKAAMRASVAELRVRAAVRATVAELHKDVQRRLASSD